MIFFAICILKFFDAIFCISTASQGVLLALRRNLPLSRKECSVPINVVSQVSQTDFGSRSYFSDRSDNCITGLLHWTREHDIAMSVNFEVISTDARQETIVAESNNHDLLVMGASRKSVIKKLFFGSLAETVAQKCRKPLLIVYHPDEGETSPGSHE